MSVSIMIVSALLLIYFCMWSYHTAQYHIKKNSDKYLSNKVDRHLILSETYMVITLCLFIIAICLEILK